MEKKEPSYTVGGNVNWYNHYGEQYGGSFFFLKIFSMYFFFRSFLKFFIYLFLYLFLAVLGLRFCARAFSSCGEWGPLFIVVHGPLKKLFKKLKIELQYNPAIPLLGIYPEERYIIHNA